MSLTLLGVGRHNAIGGGAFSPLDLGAKLKAWWDHTDLSSMFTDTGGTTAVTTDADVVARVNDKSGNAKHKLQSTSGARPIFRNDGSLPRLLYDDVDDYMEVATAGFPLVDLGIFSVFRLPSSNSGMAGVIWGFGPLTPSSTWGAQADTLRIEYSFWSNTNCDFIAVAPNLSTTVAGVELTKYRLDFIIASGVATLLRKGVSASTDSSFTALASTHTGAFREGCGGSFSNAAQSFSGIEIMEVLVVAAPDATDQTNIRSWLDTRHGT